MFRHPLFVPSLAAVLAVSILASAYLIARNGQYFFKSQASDIAVTGSTSMDFTSDLAVWQGQFTRKAMDLKEVYAFMKQDKQVIERFLESKGIGPGSYAFLSIDILPQNKTVNHYNDEGDLVDREQIFDGYRLNRSFKVTTTDINLVERVANEVTELIEQDVYITSYPPKYYYTQLGELKIQMIEAVLRTALSGRKQQSLAEAVSWVTFWKPALASSKYSAPIPTKVLAGAARSILQASSKRLLST